MVLTNLDIAIDAVGFKYFKHSPDIFWYFPAHVLVKDYLRPSVRIRRLNALVLLQVKVFKNHFPTHKR